MRGLYLVYRVFPDGDSRPETIVAVEKGDLKAAAAALERLAGEDSPEFILHRGERWAFVPQDEAPPEDWDEIAPADPRCLPY